MTVKRWAVLEIELDEGQVEAAKNVDGTIEEYIEQELAWSRESFAGLTILEISDEYDSGVGVDGE